MSMHTFVLYITTCYDLLWALTCNVCCYRHVKPLSFILKGISHNQSWSKYLPWHVHFRCTSLNVHTLGYPGTSWTQTPYRLPKKLIIIVCIWHFVWENNPFQKHIMIYKGLGNVMLLTLGGLIFLKVSISSTRGSLSILSATLKNYGKLKFKRTNGSSEPYECYEDCY